MTNQIRSPNDEKFIARLGCLIGATLASCGACWCAAGFSLGLFFGGLFIATFLVPAGVLEQSSPRRAVFGFVAITAPIALFWMIAVPATQDTIGQVVEAILVLVCYALAIAGIALALRSMKMPAMFAAAIAILVGVAWLTWPVWLVMTLTQNGMEGVIRHLVAIHPPLVINGILTAEPAWTERSVAYHLTNLNQDVPVQLPQNDVLCAFVHGIVGVILCGAAQVFRVLQSPSSRLQ